MTRTADAVIIGGGIMGASTAYHLARRGCTNIVLLESADMFGTGATGLNAGGVRHQFSSAVNIELSKLSFAMMERFADDMAQEISLRRCGYLFLFDNETDVDQARRNVALQNAHGVPSRMLTVGEIITLAPEVVLDGIMAGSWCHLDGLVDPHGLLQGYVAGASRLGATLLAKSAVTAIDVGRDGTHTVHAAKDAFQTRNVVFAAGPWSARVGKLAGIDIPIVPIRRQIAVTSAIPGLRSDFPFVIDFSRALYFHREGAGLLTGMSNRDEPPAFDTTIDEAWRLKHLECAVERLPLLAETDLTAEWAGLYEVTPDDQPILGKLPHAPGLFICAGFSGHGLMHGPATGLLMAEEILDGRAHTIDIEPLRWSRFENGRSVAEYNVV